MAGKKLWIIGCVVLLGLCCISSGVIVFFANREVDAVAAASVACDRQPVPGAKAYVPHTQASVLTFEHQTSGAWTYAGSMTPTSWHSADVAADATLVFCVEPEQRQMLESCAYEHGSVTNRFALTRHIRAVVAITGQTLREADVRGREPDPCARYISTHGVGTNEAVGDDVSGVEFDAAFGDLIR